MRDRVIVGIDVGTSKITTIIGTIPEDGPINILGVSTVESKGLKKGQVVDIEAASFSIGQSLEGAERMAGYAVSSAYVSVGGSHISSQNSHGVVAVAEPDKEITTDDIRRVVEAARAITMGPTKEVIHVLPRGFIVDSQEGIADPIGMTGVRLEVDTHLITAGATAVRNLKKCVESLGVNVEGLVFNGLASSSAVLTQTERELGVVVVDFGGGTTDIALFVEGALAYSSVIPIGARNITNDLAIGLRVSIESAEKIKLALAQKTKSGVDEDKKEKSRGATEDEIDIAPLGIAEEIKKTSRKTLIEGIIRPRLNEIFTMVGLEIKKSGFSHMTPSGLIITGGGAETVTISEVARRNLAMPVRVGVPQNITGLIDEILTPAYATSVGLLQYGAKFEHAESKTMLGDMSKIAGKISVKGMAGKLFDTVKNFLP